jgi:hypothetical protein
LKITIASLKLEFKLDSKLESKHKLGSRGQVWTMDFLVGIMLFILALIIAAPMMLNLYPSQDYSNVYRDAIYLSDNLLSEGYPSNWTVNDVVLPGIAPNNRLDPQKLFELNSLEYARLKTVFHIDSDFIVFIKNTTSDNNIINITASYNGNNVSQCIFGYNVSISSNSTVSCTPLLNTLSYENLVRVDRIIIYNSKVVTMTLYAWN